MTLKENLREHLCTITLKSGKELDKLEAMKKNEDKRNVYKEKQGEKVKKLEEEEEVRLGTIHFPNNPSP